MANSNFDHLVQVVEVSLAVLTLDCSSLAQMEGDVMKFIDQEVKALGMGCWPIGGEMYAGTTPVGYSNANDAESLRTIAVRSSN